MMLLYFGINYQRISKEDLLTIAAIVVIAAIGIYILYKKMRGNNP